MKNLLILLVTTCLVLTAVNQAVQLKITYNAYTELEAIRTINSYDETERSLYSYCMKKQHKERSACMLYIKNI